MLSRETWLAPLIAGLGVLEEAKAGLALGAQIVEKAQTVVDAQADSIRCAIAAGVRVAMGTDSGVTPHGHNLEEPPLMVEFGMTPAQALHTATLSAATLMGMDNELVTLEAGKLADLVIVDGDPLDVSELASRVRRVYQNGQLVHAAAP